MIVEEFNNINQVPSNTGFTAELVSSSPDVYLMWETDVETGLLSNHFIQIPADLEFVWEEFSDINQVQDIGTFTAELVSTGPDVYLMWNSGGTPGFLSSHWFIWVEEGIGGGYVEALGVIGYDEPGPGYEGEAPLWEIYGG